MAKSQATEFYHADDFFAIGEQMLEAWKKDMDDKKGFYKGLCVRTAKLLNSAGLHEEFTVDPAFINNFADHEIEEASGVFLRSKSGYQVICTFSIEGKRVIKIQIDIQKPDK